MMQTRPALAGDRFVAVGGSGGGYGNPKERDAEQVLDDVLDGYISREEALTHYGVKITDDNRIDREETNRLRR